MAKLKHGTDGSENDLVIFYCPGCKQPHCIPVQGPKAWGWNGSDDKPTFTPSINVIGCCHSFVKEGQIEFLSDSKHELAGQTVEIPEWTDWPRE